MTREPFASRWIATRVPGGRPRGPSALPKSVARPRQLAASARPGRLALRASCGLAGLQILSLGNQSSTIRFERVTLLRRAFERFVSLSLEPVQLGRALVPAFEFRSFDVGLVLSLTKPRLLFRKPRLGRYQRPLLRGQFRRVRCQLCTFLLKILTLLGDGLRFRRERSPGTGDVGELALGLGQTVCFGPE